MYDTKKTDMENQVLASAVAKLGTTPGYVTLASMPRRVEAAVLWVLCTEVRRRGFISGMLTRWLHHSIERLGLDCSVGQVRRACKVLEEAGCIANNSRTFNKTRWIHVPRAEREASKARDKQQRAEQRAAKQLQSLLSKYGVEGKTNDYRGEITLDGAACLKLTTILTKDYS